MYIVRDYKSYWVPKRRKKIYIHPFPYVHTSSYSSVSDSIKNQAEEGLRSREKKRAVIFREISFPVRSISSITFYLPAYNRYGKMFMKVGGDAH